MLSPMQQAKCKATPGRLDKVAIFKGIINVQKYEMKSIFA